MSVHSEENVLLPSSDSFWEPGNYKRTTKRIEDGHRLCDDLMKLVAERAEIEKSYAKSLKTWNKKWFDAIEKGPEYGTCEAAWKAALVEADRRCDLHLRVRDNLLNDVQSKIKHWQKNNFHRSMMQFKEKRDMDDAFKKSQKPWAKLLQKVNKAKSEYHTACKSQRTAAIQERNAASDDSMSAEALKKLSDRVLRVKEDVTRTKDRYETTLRDIGDYNAKYMEDMTLVFDLCQDREAVRLSFFKDALLSLHKCLNIASDPALPQIYREFEDTINCADKQKDLRWWSNSRGVNMPMNWPSFQEYSEEFREISGRSKKGFIADGNITLIHQRTVCDDLPDYNTVTRLTSTVTKPTQNGSGVKGTTSSTNRRQMSGDSAVPSSGHSSNDGAGDSSAAGTEDWDEYTPDDGLAPDSGLAGVPVRALYDYTGVETDELTFRSGDELEKLEDEDDQGWCKGRHHGRVGLYPANYVQVV